MNELLSYVGHKVRDLRGNLGLSRNDLATKLGMHQNELYAIERGIGDMTLTAADRLASALGIHVGELLPIRSGPDDKTLREVIASLTVASAATKDLVRLMDSVTGKLRK
jgi:transcriptional regulator with XRE-family HTH domain